MECYIRDHIINLQWRREIILRAVNNYYSMTHDTFIIKPNIIFSIQVSDIQVSDGINNRLNDDGNITIYDTLIWYYNMNNNNFNEINVISKLNAVIGPGNSLTFVCIHT